VVNDIIRSAQLPLGCYFVLIQSNQKSSQWKCFFTHRAFPAQRIQNRRLEICPYYPGAPLTCNGKIPMPFARAPAINSEFFLAEAVPLTGKKKYCRRH